MVTSVERPAEEGNMKDLKTRFARKKVLDQQRKKCRMFLDI